MKKLFSVTRTVSTTTDVVVDDVVADRMINAIDHMDPAMVAAIGVQVDNAARQAGMAPMPFPHFNGAPPMNAVFTGPDAPAEAHAANVASAAPASDGSSPSETASPVAASDGSPAAACPTCVGRPGLTPAGTPCPDCTK